MRSEASHRVRAQVALALLAAIAMMLASARASGLRAAELPERFVADRFVINTSAGSVVARVHGGAAGLTNAGLTQAIRTAVARSYAVQCGAVRDGGTASYAMDWTVTNDPRKPLAVITVALSHDGHTVKSMFARTVAPGSAPDAVFTREVSALSRGILPPATPRATCS